VSRKTKSRSVTVSEKSQKSKKIINNSEGGAHSPLREIRAQTLDKIGTVRMEKKSTKVGGKDIPSD